MRRVLSIALIVCALVAAHVIIPTEPSIPVITESSVAVELARAGDAAMSRPVPPQGDIVGVTWDGHAPEEVEIRFQRDGTWSPWVELHVDDEHAPDAGTHESENTRPSSEPTAFKDADLVQIRVEAEATPEMELAFVDVQRPRSATAPARAATDIRPRSDWDPGNQCAPREEPEEIQLDIAFVHHTGIDRAYSSSEVPDIILGYCLYHRNGRGWDDIAYNFLIDRFGTVWEGRAGGIDKGIRGGHTKGFNSYSTGIALIGNYTFSAPPSSQRAALTDLLTWKLGHHNIDPYARTTVVSLGSFKWAEGAGVTMNAISGHRDAQATACPGNKCYNLLGDFRATVADDFRAIPVDAFRAPVVGDFTGDGVDDGAVFAVDDATWLVTDGATGTTSSWGNPTPGFVPGTATAVPLDGDARTDIVAAGSGSIVSLRSGSGSFSAESTSVSGTAVEAVTLDAGGDWRAAVVMSNGAVLVSPGFSSIGSVPDPVDADGGDLDGDGVDEVVVLDGSGTARVVSLDTDAAIDGAALTVGGSDRVAVGAFLGGGVDSIAAVDIHGGDARLVVPSGSALVARESIDFATGDRLTEVFATDEDPARLVVLDARVGEWKVGRFDGSGSYVTLLEDQAYRTHVTASTPGPGSSFLSWYGREFGWLQSRFGYGTDDDTNATVAVTESSRYTTNTAMSRLGFDAASEVVLATSAKFPDALAAGAVAARLGGPLLLTEPGSLPGVIADEIRRLGAERVTIAGGPVAVAPQVEDALRDLGVTVRRLGGADRYETAALLSSATFESADTVYIATGTNFPDALAGVPAAALRDAPILLVSDRIPAATRAELERLAPSTVYVLGGPVAVPDTVFDDIEAIVDGEVVRQGGANRYETARIVSADAFGGSGGSVFVASGLGFLDALIAGPIAARMGAPVLLVSDSVPGSVYDEVASLRPDRIVLVGRAGDEEIVDGFDGIGPSTSTSVLGWVPRP